MVLYGMYGMVWYVKNEKRKKEKMKMKNNVFVKNPFPWLKAPAGAFFIVKNIFKKKSYFLTYF